MVKLLYLVGVLLVVGEVVGSGKGSRNAMYCSYWRYVVVEIRLDRAAGRVFCVFLWVWGLKTG